MGGIRRAVDTRNKILNTAELRRVAGPVALATGYFDVLREEHVRELEGLGGQESGGSPRLIVAVLPLEGALLEQGARAELVASLRVVDYVIAASSSEVEELIQELQPQRVARLEAGHMRLAQELRKRVHSRRGDFTPAR